MWSGQTQQGVRGSGSHTHTKGQGHGCQSEGVRGGKVGGLR